MNESVFVERLAETIAWCTRSSLPPDLSPSLKSVIHTVAYKTYGCLPTDSQLDQLAESVFVERSKALKRIGIVVPPFGGDLKGGRLSLFFPSVAFAMDGVMQGITNGFFDPCDFPSWDTWVYHVSEPFPSEGHDPKHYLISWIPPQLLNSVQEAMRTNADSHSTKWLDQIALLDTPNFWDIIKNTYPV